MVRLCYFLLTSKGVLLLALSAIVLSGFGIFTLTSGFSHSNPQNFKANRLFTQKVFAAEDTKTATINNLGLGTSDGTRIENYVKKLASRSPIIGHGDEVVKLASEFGVDPLMIFIFQNESQFCSDNGVVSPGGSDPDNYNCGGITWEAAQVANVTRWHATAGPQALGHTFAFVPTIMDGVGLYFDYISKRYPNATLENFYNTYNPCDDPGNTGQDCGAEAIAKMYETLKENVGDASDGGTTPVPKGSVTLKLVLKPLENDSYVINKAVAEIVAFDTADPKDTASTSASQ
ncbi:MAG: hypothetical protein HZC02_05670 [Candidatus Levybacteria bacterium]|nr:hypothetical protein [Candidatus Levybacteria bacterium]